MEKMSSLFAFKNMIKTNKFNINLKKISNSVFISKGFYTIINLDLYEFLVEQNSYYKFIEHSKSKDNLS